MPVLGITGGIGAGKTTAVALLGRTLGGTAFDADRCGHELLESDPDVISAVRRAFGPGVIGADGSVDRGKLRATVFQDQARRKELESILHPRIRERWTTDAERFRAEAARWLLLDIPLLFETGAEKYADRTLVIACAPSTQRARLSSIRGLDDAMIEKIIGAQLDLDAKMTKSDHVIWNDSTLACLERQTEHLSRWLLEYYG